MNPKQEPALLHLALPKGRMQAGVIQLLADAAIQLRLEPRGYRAQISLPAVDVKILKPQNIIEMLDAGSRDVGFAGADWVEELEADLVELLDLELDPVDLVAAAPAAILEGGKLPSRPLVLASEYERISRRWLAEKGIEARFVRSYGATEVFPPEDADCIIDNTATGSTLRANRLDIVDVVLRSSTRLYASRAAMENPRLSTRIEDLVMLLKSALAARQRVMLELNVPADKLEAIVRILPCMREPTVSPLNAQQGFAVKAAVGRSELATLIPQLKLAGGGDLVVSQLSQIVP